MKNIFYFLFAFFLLVYVSSCTGVIVNSDPATQVHGVGQETNMSQFVDINVVGAMNVIYSIEDKYTVRVEAQRDIFSHLIIYVDDNELYITSRDMNVDSAFVVGMKGVKVYVTCPEIHKITLTGEGSFTTSSSVYVSHLGIDLTGSGLVDFGNKLSSKSLNVDLTGSGVVNIANLKSAKLNSKLTGSGSINYKSLDIESAESHITGSGMITMKGSVTDHSKNVNGSGTIKETP